MRPRMDSSELAARGLHSPTRGPDISREVQAVAELFAGVFRRDVQSFLPRLRIQAIDLDGPTAKTAEPGFRFLDDTTEGAHQVTLFGRVFSLTHRSGPLQAVERRMVQAIASVLTQRYLDLFGFSRTPRPELYRGGTEDHYVAAFMEQGDIGTGAHVPQQRIAATIHTLRTAALSTYENRRVSTGALLLASSESSPPIRQTAQDALAYGVELTALKSIHRLCDGRRTLFLVDPAGKLADIIDVADWSAAIHGQAPNLDEIPCARSYEPHARATMGGGNVCLVLSPNQEIKLFAEGRQVFAFTHGRWRILDPAARFVRWAAAVDNVALARRLFQAALDLAEDRQGALFVVVRNTERAAGKLVALHDLLDNEPEPSDASASDSNSSLWSSSCELPMLETGPLARRALHYLARGRLVTELPPSVLESLASLDGALVTDTTGRLLAFGAILHHDAPELRGLSRAEGARTTAAIVASLYGPVLKVSEDGIVSCFLDGTRVWDL